MNNKLKEITDLTVNELLSQDVIFPSNYLQCFDKHAKLINIDLNDESFEKEIDDIILNEFNSINKYIIEATKTVEQAALATLDAQKAIESNNSSALKELYKEIKTLQDELENMTENIYKDHLTKAYNKKWLYHKYLSEEATFKNNASIIFIEIGDYNYISETYNKLLADNMLIFIIKFIQKKFHEEGVTCKIARYLTNKFLIILDKNDNNDNDLETFFSNVSTLLKSTTLKSNSGVLIKPSCDYSVIEVLKDKSFHDTLNTLY